MCMCSVVSYSFATPWTIAHQAPLSMGFSRQEYWSGLPCPPTGDFPNPGIKPTSLMSPALAGDFFTTSATWKTHYKCELCFFKTCIYLVLAALGLHCYMWVFSSCSEWEFLFLWLMGLSWGGLSCCGAQAPGCMGFRICST